MPIPFKPLPDGEPLLDTKQFLFRLKHDPGFAETMQRHYEAALALPLNEDTAEMHKAAAGALRLLKHHQGAWKAMKLLQKTLSLIDDESCEPSEIVTQAKTLTAEATDHLLDVLEPERTKLMNQIAGVREMIEDLQNKRD